MIPGDLASFKELFLQLGVHDGFAAPQYLNMLSDLAEVSQGKVLSPAELEQAISVVQVGTAWSVSPALRLSCQYPSNLRRSVSVLAIPKSVLSSGCGPLQAWCLTPFLAKQLLPIAGSLRHVVFSCTAVCP